jgi:simple sugar transport system permease protein
MWNFAEFLAAVPLVGEPIVAAMTAFPTVFEIIPIVGADIASFMNGALDFVFLVLFDAIPTVYMLLIAAPLSWYVINHTSFGRWVRASGENPKALDTAGVNVTRVRYSAVILSGILSGIGGIGASARLGGRRA